MMKGKISFILFIVLSAKLFSQHEPIRVACVGNSITWGGLGDKSYPQQLGKLLGPHYEVKNFGISGRALLRKSDFPYWNEYTFQEAKDYNPQIIIIKLGTNDTKPQNWKYANEFYKDYLDFIAEFRKSNVKPQIFISYPCPVFHTEWGIRDSIVKIIIPIIDSVRFESKTDLIDFNTPLLDSANLFPDGVHPNANGYFIMAEIAKDAILNSPAGIIRFFKSDKMNFNKGEPCRLFWETTIGSEVTLNGSAVNEIDSIMVNLSESKTFTLIAKGEDRADTIMINLVYDQPGKIKSFYVKPRMLELDASDSAKIYWSTASGSSVFLDNTAVEANGNITVVPKITSKFILTAAGDTLDYKEIMVQVLPAEQINRSLDNNIKSSSAAKNFPVEYANDGDTTTFWKSKNEATPWLYVDFNKIINLKKVKLTWGRIFAVGYQLQTINDKGLVNTIFTQSNGVGGNEDIDNLTGSSRYLRLLCTQKNLPEMGYELKEFEIYGENNISSVSEKLPYNYYLYQNYPNPFNPITTINYSISSIGWDNEIPVKIIVFDILGREIETLVNEKQNPGNYSIELNINSKSFYSSGIYFYRLQTSNFIDVKKMVVLK